MIFMKNDIEQTDPVDLLDNIMVPGNPLKILVYKQNQHEHLIDEELLVFGDSG